MTDSTTKPDNQSKPDPKPEQLSLSVTQVLASVLAAVSASVAASVFGVAGTVIGAALGSAITVVGSAVYAQSLKRSRNAVRLTLGGAATRRQGGRGPEPAIPPADPDLPPDERGGPPGEPDLPPDERGARRRLPVALTPQRLAAGAGAVFVLTLGLITGFELLTGKPVAASMDGRQGSGLSVLGGAEGSAAVDTPSPASPASSSTTPGASSLGTAAPTPTVTVTFTPSTTPSAALSATPPATPPATPTPTPSATPPATQPAGSSGSAVPSPALSAPSAAGTSGGG